MKRVFAESNDEMTTFANEIGDYLNAHGYVISSAIRQHAVEYHWTDKDGIRWVFTVKEPGGSVAWILTLVTGNIDELPQILTGEDYDVENFYRAHDELERIARSYSSGLGDSKIYDVPEVWNVTPVGLIRGGRGMRRTKEAILDDLIPDGDLMRKSIGENSPAATHELWDLQGEDPFPPGPIFVGTIEECIQEAQRIAQENNYHEVPDETVIGRHWSNPEGDSLVIDAQYS